MMELERFIAGRVSDQDPAKAAEAKLTSTKLRALRGTFNGEMFANIYDDGGHAILMAAVILPPEKTTMHAFLHDGTEVVAKVVGTNFVRGFTVLQIEQKNGTSVKGSFNALAAGKPETGEMLMNLSINSGALAFGYMPVSGFGKKADGPFSYNGSGLLFTTRGELSAFVSDGNAVTFASLAEEIKAMAAGSTILPKTLGIVLGAFGEPSERTKKAIAGKNALRVAGILDGSPAKFGDIQKNDFIIAIDGQPATVAQLERVVEGWQLKGNELKIELVREGELLIKTIKSDKPN
jgi:hypothetical protein